MVTLGRKQAVRRLFWDCSQFEELTRSCHIVGEMLVMNSDKLSVICTHTRLRSCVALRVQWGVVGSRVGPVDSEPVCWDTRSTATGKAAADWSSDKWWEKAHGGKPESGKGLKRTREIRGHKVVVKPRRSFVTVQTHSHILWS
eukprot:3438270-Amphidinium_carterae.2